MSLSFEDLEKLEEKVYIKDGSITVHVEYPYDVPLSACSTEKQILSYAKQIAEKNWATREVILRFIELACRKNNIQL